MTIAAVCASLGIGLSFPKWDCINAQLRKTTEVAQLKASASLLTSQSQAHTAAKATPLAYGVLNSLLRQTARWREMDSNLRFRADKRISLRLEVKSAM